MSVTLPTRTDGYPAYDFAVELDGALFSFAMRWNDRDAAWYMSIADSLGVLIVSGVRVVPGWDLLRRSVDPRRPQGAIVAVDTTGGGMPGLTDLGARVLLVYDSDEFEAVL